mmetsp:Transcript_56592/g.150903  ORF Transcript_56592/g.150903 Transcript_56592/m.150903 type:complete len:200 (-) Transcript_56592:571-1170(-)
MHLTFQPLVLRNCPSRRDGELDEHHTVDPALVLLQEQVERLELLRQTLHVIQAIDTQNDLAVPVLLLELLQFQLHFVLVQRIDEDLGIDTNWDRGALHQAPAHRGGVHPVRRRVQRGKLHASGQKMPDVVVHVESQQVGGEQPLHQLQPPGQHAVQLGGWKGCVQKEPHVNVRLPVPQHLWNEHQMVIVHPHVVSRLPD